MFGRCEMTVRVGVCQVLLCAGQVFCPPLVDWCTKCPQHPHGLETVSRLDVPHTQRGNRKPGGDSRQQKRRQCLQCVGGCIRVRVCVCARKGKGGALKAQISSGGVSPSCGWVRASGAAGVVYDQRDVKAVHLQQVKQEGAIALRIQPHDPHVLSSEGGISAPGYLRKGLEDAVVQLHEEPGMGIQDSGIMLPSSTSFYSQHDQQNSTVCLTRARLSRTHRMKRSSSFDVQSSSTS